MTSALPRLARSHRPPKVEFHALPGAPPSEYYCYAPASAGRGAPLLILVHGITRHAAETIFRFREEADRLGIVLLAPYFSATAYRRYQLVIDDEGRRADLALFDMIEATALQTGCQKDKVHLFGYSGGAQFVHRFTMIHPGQVASMSVASAGWYTMPDPGEPYPYGIGSHPLQSHSFDAAAFLRIERHILVGSRDRQRDHHLRTSKKLDRLQGRDRVERACRWNAMMNAASQQWNSNPPDSSFELLQGVGHSFTSSARRRSLPQRVVARLFPEHGDRN